MTLARNNPFRLDRVLTLRYRPARTTISALADRFELLGGRAAIVGPHGSGKTTLLEDLAATFQARGIPVSQVSAEELNSGSAAIRPLSPETVIVLDSAGLLTRRGRRAARLAARTHKVLVTTHRPVWLPTLWTCRTSPELLRELVKTLSESRADSENLRSLFVQHRGNVRKVFEFLYELASQDPTPGSDKILPRNDLVAS